MATTTFWATVEPTFGRVWKGDKLVDGVKSIKVTGVTQKQPERRSRIGTVTCKLTLEIPDGAFLPLRPEAIIVVPEDMVLANLPVTVEAHDPTQED